MVKDDEVLFRLETPGEYEQRPASSRACLTTALPTSSRAPRRRLREARRPLPCAQEPSRASVPHEAPVRQETHDPPQSDRAFFSLLVSREESEAFLLEDLIS